MKQAAFEAQHRAFWQQCEERINELENHRSDHSESFAAAFRQLCHHLAIARHRGYSPHLTDYLNQLNWRGHQLLYRRPSATWQGLSHFIGRQFPIAVRQHKGFIMLAGSMMLVPALMLIALLQWQPDWIHYLSDGSQIKQYEAMYDPTAAHIGRARQADTNVEMFGFYIRNNIGVAFRTFATGIVFTLGSVFFLVFNGFFFGIVAGHLTAIGYTQPFWTFVIAHAAFEITAIVIAGAAGIKLGFAVLAPAHLRRLDALKQSATEVVPLLYGLTIMLIIAAFIEAFWSSNSSIAPGLKYLSGAVLWCLVISYFVCCGRRHKPSQLFETKRDRNHEPHLP